MNLFGNILALGLWGIMKKIIRNFVQNNDGATAIEYGLIVALIALVLITSVNNIGNNLVNIFSDLSNRLS